MKKLFFIFSTLLLLSVSAQNKPTAIKSVSKKEPLTKATQANDSKTKTWTVEEALNYAIKNSLEIKKTEISLQDRGHFSSIARAEFDPTIDANSVSDTHFDSVVHSVKLSQDLPAGFSTSVTGAHTRNNEDATDSTGMAFRLSKQILGGGSLNASLRNIRDAYTNELIDFNNLKRDKRRLTKDFMDAFYDLIKDTKALSISERRLEISKRNLEMAIERDDPMDIVSAKVQVPNDELKVISSRFLAKSALDRLKVLMGLSPSTSFKIDTDFEFALSQPDSSNDIKYAQENSEDFLNLALTKIKIIRELELRKEQILPSVSLSASHFLTDETDQNVNLRGDEETVVGVDLTWTIGNRREKAQLAIAQNEIRQNDIDQRILYNDKFRSLRLLERAMLERSISIKTKESEIELNILRVALFKDRWESGKMGILEYLRSQNDLENSRIELNNLKTSYMSNLQAYLFETGMETPPSLTLQK
jgi:outer membrane protein TolC